MTGQDRSEDPHVVSETPAPVSLLRSVFRMRSSRGSAISVSIAALLSVGLIFASSHFRRTPPPPPPAMRGVKVEKGRIAIARGAPQWSMIAVGRAVPSKDRWTDPVPAEVRVDETSAARVGSPLSGRVNRVFVELGQAVKKGDSLFSVSSPDLASLNADRAKASVELETAKSALDRVQAIVAARALPQKDEIAAAQRLEQAQVDYRVAQARLGSLRIASSSDSEFVVKSPRGGNVVQKDVLPGQEVAADAGTLMTVADLSSVWVVAQLFESNATGIEPGTQARITVSSAPGTPIQGVVEMVSAVVDPVRHSIPVRVRLDNPDGKLKPNTYAHMQFLAKPPPGAVEIASTSIVTDGAHQYVYLRGHDGAFSRRAVVAGPAREGRVLILSGLKAGETVVERGAILLDNQIAISQ